jgi:transposase
MRLNGMRGADQQQGHVFSYLSPEQRVRKDHPLRPIRDMVDRVLKELSPEFDKMYSKVGRPSIPPEQLLRALLLPMLYWVRSERMLMEEIDYNILFRWFVGLNLDDEVWDATVFTKNRDRLLEAEVAKDFLALVVEQARGQGWASDEHFTVDGTLLEAWASAKSFQPKNKKGSFPPEDPGNPTVNYRGEKRSNQTHESKSDPEAQMARRGQGGQVELQRESAGGESQRFDCGQPGVGSHRHGGALRGAGNAARTSGKRAGDGGRRQGLRHSGFRARVPEHLGDAARGAKPWTKRGQRH